MAPELRAFQAKSALNGGIHCKIKTWLTLLTKPTDTNIVAPKTQSPRSQFVAILKQNG
jgi:hypothetical protein